MANETVITIVGNLTAEPEIRFTASGAPVCSFTIASTPRTFDRNSGGWKDGEALFMRCSAWREMAENIAETCTKGMRVVATGRLQQRSYETQNGERRTVVEMQVEEIGPSLRYASAQVQRKARGEGGNFAGTPGGAGGGYGDGFAGAPAGAGAAGGGMPAPGGYQQGNGFQPQPGGNFAPQPGGFQPGGNFAPAEDPWASAGSGSSGFDDPAPF